MVWDFVITIDRENDMDVGTMAIGSGGMGRSRGKLVTGVLSSMVLALLVQASTASAVVPGANGRIACEGGRVLAGGTDTNPEVFTINPDGSGEMILTDFPGRDGDPPGRPTAAPSRSKASATGARRCGRWPRTAPA